MFGQISATGLPGMKGCSDGGLGVDIRGGLIDRDAYALFIPGNGASTHDKGVRRQVASLIRCRVDSTAIGNNVDLIKRSP